MPEDCIIRSKWPKRDRWAIREMLTELPCGGTNLR